jgi:hypothetical protein
VACLDYSVAKGGFLCAYRWNGEQKLRNENFVSNTEEYDRFKDPLFHDYVVAEIILRRTAEEAGCMNIEGWEKDPDYIAALKNYQEASKRYFESRKGQPS